MALEHPSTPRRESEPLLQSQQDQSSLEVSSQTLWYVEKIYKRPFENEHVSQIKNFFYLDVLTKIFRSILLKAQLQNYSFSSYERCPLLHGVWSIYKMLSSYTLGLSLDYAYRFSTLCLKHGPRIYSSTLGSSLSFISFTFFLSSLLARIHHGLPFKAMKLTSLQPLHTTKMPKTREIHLTL